MRSSLQRSVVVLLVTVACGERERSTGGEGREPGAASDSGGNTAVEPDSATSSQPTTECVHPRVERSCKNGLCNVPSGCFVMGTPRDAVTAARYDNVEVEVRLTHAFLIGETEVTREQWFAMGLPEPAIDWEFAYRTGAPDLPPPGQSPCLEPSCPVVWINFEDAAAYANLRSEAEGLEPCYALGNCVRSPGESMRCASVRVNAKSPYECEGYRLPTEAEWEYAARAGTRTDLPTGDLDPAALNEGTDCILDENLDRIGWYCANSGHPSRQAGTGRPYQVAQKEPNGFGLYDTAGNAFEWVNDRYTPGGYGTARLTDPVYGVEEPSDLTPSTPVFHGMNDGLFTDGFPGYRVMRSGAFDLWARVTGSGLRHYGVGAGVQHNGMRIARTLQATAEER